MPEYETAADLIAVLARDHRLLVVVIPDGIPDEDIQALNRDVSARLDVLAEERDWRRGHPDA